MRRKIDETLQQRELDKIRDDWLTIRVEYDAEFLAQFKAAVPADNRAWDSGDSVWYVSPEYAPETERLTRRYFTTKNGIGWQDAWSILHLTRGATSAVIECVSECLLASEPNPQNRLRIETARELLLEL